MADSTMRSIVLVDDAPDIRALVGARLRLSRAFVVVGEGASGADAIRLAAEHEPDLLLLDVSMPGMDGLEAIAAIRTASPATRIVMFSGFDEEGLADRARALGATAFVQKSLPMAELAGMLLEIAGVAYTEPPADTTTAGLDDDQALLDEHLERFRAAFEQAAIGMATMTLTGRVVRANAELSRVAQCDPTGLLYAELADDATRPTIDALITSVASGRLDVGTTVHTIGSAWVMSTVAIVRDLSGNALYLFLQAQDVTEQRLAEQELRQSEERFRQLVEGVRDYAIIMLDPSGQITSWNTGAQRIIGYTAQEIVGQHFSRFYDDEARAAGHPQHELDVALAEGRYEEEGSRVRKDGTRFWANVIVTAVRDERGRHVGFAKITRDITARRAADEALRRSEERFRLLVDGASDYAIFMLDPEGRISSWNPGAQRAKGYTADEIIGQHFSVFYTDEACAAEHPAYELRVARATGRYEEEGWRIRKDGTPFWANVVITALHDDTGTLVGFGKVTRDITERMRARLELEQANEQLRNAARDRTEFLAVTAHELRGPVALLRGYSELLRDGWRDLADDARDEMIDTLVRTGTRLTRLVEDLLTASRLESGALVVRVAPTPLAPIVVNVVADLAPPGGDAQVAVRCPPDAHVLADPIRLQQMLTNLLSNALRYGAPPFALEATALDQWVEIVVVDAGPGVPAAVRERLFEKFVHGSHEDSNGLGLFIVRALAEAQGGAIAYVPGAASGARFALRLPIATATTPA